MKRVEQLPLLQFGRDQDELHQAAGLEDMSRTFKRQVNELHILVRPFSIGSLNWATRRLWM